MTKQELIQEALDNLRDDRSATNKLLSDLKGEIVAQDATNAKAGIVAAKYVETLQRSNEQLVKLTAILAKKTDPSVSLTEKDKKELFDVIQGDKQ